MPLDFEITGRLSGIGTRPKDAGPGVGGPEATSGLGVQGLALPRRGSPTGDRPARTRGRPSAPAPILDHRQVQWPMRPRRHCVLAAAPIRACRRRPPLIIARKTVWAGVHLPRRDRPWACPSRDIWQSTPHGSSTDRSAYETPFAIERPRNLDPNPAFRDSLAFLLPKTGRSNSPREQPTTISPRRRLIW